MNQKARIEMVKAMECIIRSLNDESLIYEWLLEGVADGDIRDNTSDKELEYYIEDERYAELMGTFLRIVSSADNDGLYSDGILASGE